MTCTLMLPVDILAPVNLDTGPMPPYVKVSLFMLPFLFFSYFYSSPISMLQPYTSSNSI